MNNNLKTMINCLLTDLFLEDDRQKLFQGHKLISNKERSKGLYSSLTCKDQSAKFITFGIGLEDFKQVKYKYEIIIRQKIVK
jgi:hypothetical protein